jgi:hypothetical protein
MSQNILPNASVELAQAVVLVSAFPLDPTTIANVVEAPFGIVPCTARVPICDPHLLARYNAWNALFASASPYPLPAHEAEPLKDENLADLQQKVIKENANL